MTRFFWSLILYLIVINLKISDFEIHDLFWDKYIVSHEVLLYLCLLSATSLLEALQVESIKDLKELNLTGVDTFEITKVSIYLIYLF